MGNTISINQIQQINLINFEAMQTYKNKSAIIINTLDANNQSCLIIGTINISQEEELLNDYLINNKEKYIYIYGKNGSDKTLFNKYKQLLNLGLKNVFIYSGGLFEWLLLQEIYGDLAFPTTDKELDILKYK